MPTDIAPPVLPVCLVVGLSRAEDFGNRVFDGLRETNAAHAVLLRSISLSPFEMVFHEAAAPPGQSGSRHPLGGLASFAAALRQANMMLTAEMATLVRDGRPARPPLVIVVTDRPLVAEDRWQAALQEFVDANPGAVVEPVWCSRERRAVLPAHRNDVERRHSHLDSEDPLGAAIDIVHSYVKRPRPSPRPRPDDQPAEWPAQEPRSMDDENGPAWEGGFTPYAVGDGGAAARTVRPVPDPAEWDRRDTVLDGVCIRNEHDSAALELRAASVRGLSHRFYGTVRQDDYAFRCAEDRRYLVAVVADGVSSGKLSHKAANLIVRIGSERLATVLADRNPDEIDWHELMDLLAGQIFALGEKVIERPADGEPLTVRDVAACLASTALFAVVDLRPMDEQIRVRLFAVGDSPAWVLRNGTVWEPQQPLKNQHEGPASSSTDALPLKRSGFAPAVATTLYKNDVLVLMTDGVADPLGDGMGVVGRFLAEVWSRPPAPLAFAAQVDFARRTHDDDRTALAIWTE